MRWSSLLLLLALSSLIAFTGCERDRTKPGYEISFMTNMKRPIPFEPYSEHSQLSGKVTLQTPVEGTVYRGAMIGMPAKNPLEVTPENLTRGQHIYENYCLICHGVTGDGDGPMIPKYPNPPSYLTKKLLEMDDVEIFKSITFGMKDMPAHGGQIEAKDRWALIHYVRKLQEITE